MATSFLSMWTVYDHPRDYPDHIVVREHRLRPGGGHTVTMACLYNSLDEAMAECEAMGLTWMPRDDEDDPVIVGVWM